MGTRRPVIDATKHQGLGSLPGFPFQVHTSASTHEQAYDFLGEVLAFRPQCALVVLSRGALLRR